MMRELDTLWIEVDVRPGANIPASAIPDLIELANRLGVTVQAKANGVLVMAGPGDDPIDLAIAWEVELRSKRPHPIAVAWQGREHRIRQLTTPTEGEGG